MASRDFPEAPELEAIRRTLLARRFGIWEWTLATERLTIRRPKRRGAGDVYVSLRVHADDAVWFSARCREALESGAQAVALPVRAYVEDDTVAWFLAAGGLRTDVDGTVGLGGFVVEVVYARLSVESLYAAVLDSLTEQVAIANGRGEIVETNRAWAAAADTQSLVPGRRISLGTNIIDAFRASDRNERSMMARVTAGIDSVVSGRSEHFETEYSVEGDGRSYGLRVSQLQRPEGGLVIVLHDITDRRQAERERALHRAELGRTARAAVLGQLSGAIAHELNQPLTAILANAQAGIDGGRQGVAKSELLEILREIENDTKRAGEVIKRVRRLLHTDQSGFAPLDLNQVVEDVLLLIRSDFLLRGVTFTKALEPGLPLVYGDSIQLQQLVLNLVLNACEAISTSERKELHIETCIGPQGGLRMIVSDSGPGFDMSNPEKVLQPFYTTKKHGLGLGLTICRSIVQAHGGSLQLSNYETGGGRITIDFPAFDPLDSPDTKG